MPENWTLHGSRSTLTVFEEPSGRLAWEGNLDGIQARKIVRFGTRTLVLLAYEQGGSRTFENILCFDAAGRLIWRAELPDIHDVYVDFEERNGAVEATTWNGLHVSLDPITGRVRDSKFVK